MLLRLYQIIISPLYKPCCRFFPSCSEYARLSIKKYGLLYGILKTLVRLLRCAPWGKSGIDFP